MGDNVVCKHKNVEGTTDALMCCNEDGDDYCMFHNGPPEQCPHHAQHCDTNQNLVDELLEALEEMLAARKKPILDIVGHHPVDGHPLNASGVASLKAQKAIAKAKGEPNV